MNNLKKILCLMLAAFMLLSMAVSCTPDTPDVGESGSKSESPSESQTPADTPAETEPPAEPLKITTGNKCNYTIVRPEKCSQSVIDAAFALRNALRDATGDTVFITQDYLYGDAKPEQYEIIIGQTTREESVRALETIKYRDYVIAIDGDKLVINGYIDDTICEAVDYLIGIIESADGDVVFDVDDQKTVKAEYLYDTVTFDGVSLEGYTIVASNRSAPQMKAYAYALQRKILQVSGIYLPVKVDASSETEKEILIGETNRAESEAVDISDLGSAGYVYKVEGKKIVIKANEALITFTKTINQMVKELDSGKLSESKGKLEMSTEPLLTSFCFSDVHNNFAMLEPPYVVRGSATRAIKTMLETEGKVDVVQVGGDLMSDYPYWNKSGNLPYEYFVGYRKLLVETFSELTKDGKVLFNGGNHDYGQGEAATDGPGIGGSYNSSDFYFGDIGMRQSVGELPPEDMLVKIGEHTGEKYLICYYYEIDGIGFAGLAPDPDIIWYNQGDGLSEESLEWMDRKLDEVDPAGNKVIFVNCHYPCDNRNSSKEWDKSAWHNAYNSERLIPIFTGHKNLFHMFGHWETWYSDYTAKNMFHYDTYGKLVKINGDETESTQLISYADRGFNSVYMGHFRPSWGGHKQWFGKDPVSGYGGYSYVNVQASTATPRVGQGMFIQVYDDRVVFTMKNFGDIPGLSTDDLIVPYTVYLYK